jgi:hypothetical protein
MALISHFMGLGESVEGEKTGTWIPDQAYYDRYIRAEEEQIKGAARRRAGAIGRGGRAKQGQFLTAQGLGGTALETSQQKGLTNAFRRALSRSLQEAQMEGEALRRAKFAERDQARGESLGRIGTASNLESQIGSAILSISPYTAALAPIHGASTATAGIASTLGTQDQPNRMARAQGYDDADPIRTVEYGAPQLFTSGDPGGVQRARGGGGQDFLRQYGY